MDSTKSKDSSEKREPKKTNLNVVRFPSLDPSAPNVLICPKGTVVRQVEKVGSAVLGQNQMMATQVKEICFLETEIVILPSDEFTRLTGAYLKEVDGEEQRKQGPEEDQQG
jgi:hypothetical protein